MGSIITGAAALILVIACTNVASLLLARTTARAGELAIRTAIGAGLTRLVRQSFTETLTITALGGALGVVLAWWMLRLLVTLGPQEIPRLAEVGLDLNVLAFSLAFSLAVTLLSALAAGLAPVALAVRTGRHLSTKECGTDCERPQATPGVPQHSCCRRGSADVRPGVRRRTVAAKLIAAQSPIGQSIKIGGPLSGRTAGGDYRRRTPTFASPVSILRRNPKSSLPAHSDAPDR